MHLEVDMSQENTMTMLYKIRDGYVQEQHYGIALARVVDLPARVIEVAERVSRALEAQAKAKKQSSKAQALFKRRKLVHALRESLKHAASSLMDDKALLSWVVRLQEEFVRRMDAIDNDLESSDHESSIAEEGEGEGEEAADMDNDGNEMEVQSSSVQ